jgi:hypothetical protein
MAKHSVEGVVCFRREQSDACICCEGRHVYSRYIQFDAPGVGDLLDAVRPFYSLPGVEGQRVRLTVETVEGGGAKYYETAEKTHPAPDAPDERKDELWLPWRKFGIGNCAYIVDDRDESILDLTTATTPAQLALVLAAGEAQRENERLRAALQNALPILAQWDAQMSEQHKAHGHGKHERASAKVLAQARAALEKSP